MPEEIKTSLVVDAKPTGFAKVRDEASKTNEVVKRGARATTEGFAEGQKRVEGFNRALEGTLGALQKFFSQQQSVNKRVLDQFDALSKKVKGVESSLKDASRAAGGFTQGLVQGLGVGEFIQRGPGMWRQVAGRTMGRIAAAPVRGAVGGMLQGAGGIAQALGTIPGGGLLALPLMQSMQMAQRSMAFERQVFGQIPFLGGVGLTQRMGEARRAVGREYAPERVEGSARRARRVAWMEMVSGIGEGGAAEQRAIEAEIDRRMKPPPGTRVTYSRGIGGIHPLETRRREEEERIRADPRTMARIREQVRQDAAETERQRMTEEGSQRRARAASRVRDAFFQPIRQAGLQLGAMDRQAAASFAAQLTQVGGGRDPMQQGMMRAAVSAQTVFGVGAGISGAFLRAGRRGGLVGGLGQGGAALTQTLAEAMSLGLEGSEVVTHLQTISQGIQSWEQTGIPVNASSIASMGRSVAGMGLGGVRGGVIAGGLQRAAQAVAQGGPRDAVDMLLLQSLGGFRGGGLEGITNAMIRMERGEFGGQQMQKLFTRLAEAGGGGAGGVLTIQQALSRRGVRIGLGEAQLISRQALGERLEPEQMEKVRSIQEQLQGGREAAEKIATPQKLEDLAKAMVSDFGPALKRQASITNTQIATGKAMTKAMLDLEQTTTGIAKTFADSAGPMITEVTGAILDLSKQIRNLIMSIKGGEFSFEAPEVGG